MRFIILSITALLLSWSGGFAYYIYLVQSYKINTSAITDSVVAFGSDSQKIKYGVALLKAGYAHILFIPSVGSTTTLQSVLSEHKVIPSQVIYGMNNHTYNNKAQEVSDFIITHDIESIRLVTNDYEMPGAIEALTQLIPHNYNFHIIPHIIKSKDMQYEILFKSYNMYLKNMLLNQWQ